MVEYKPLLPLPDFRYHQGECVSRCVVCNSTSVNTCNCYRSTAKVIAVPSARIADNSVESWICITSLILDNTINFDSSYTSKVSASNSACISTTYNELIFCAKISKFLLIKNSICNEVCVPARPFRASESWNTALMSDVSKKSAE